MKKNKNGFTMIELIISISIIAMVLLLSRTIYLSVHKKTIEKLYTEKIKSIEAATDIWAQNNPDKITIIQSECPIPKNFDENYTYTCYKNLTVQELLDTKYLKSDNNSGDILDPRDKSKKLNDYTIIVYHYYNNYYAEMMDDNYEEAVPIIRYLRVNNPNISQKTTTNRNITLYLNAKNADTMCFTTIDNIDSCSWKNYSETGEAWTLTSNYEIKTIYAFVKNKTGQTNKTNVSIELIPKKVIPVYLRINNINISEESTNNQNVILYAKAENALEMCFSNTNSSNECSWKKYSETGQVWMLTSGYGEKIIYVFFKNDVGEISESISKSIYYGPYPEPIYLRINNSNVSATTTNNQSVILYAKAENALEMCFSNTNNSNNCVWINYSESSNNWTLTNGYGNKTVYVFFKGIGPKVVSTNTSINYEPIDKVIVSSNIDGTLVTAYDNTSAYVSPKLTGTCKIYNEGGTIKLYIDNVLQSKKAISKVVNGFSSETAISVTDSTAGKNKTLKVECISTSGIKNSKTMIYNVVINSPSKVCGVNEYKECNTNCAFGVDLNEKPTACNKWGKCCSSSTCSDDGYDDKLGKYFRCIDGKRDYCEEQQYPCRYGRGEICGVESYKTCYHY